MFLVHILQMSAGHHLRHCRANIKIAQTFILVTQLIDLLNGHGVIRPGCYEQDQDLYIHHIMDISKSLHFSSPHIYYIKDI